MTHDHQTCPNCIKNREALRLARIVNLFEICCWAALIVAFASVAWGQK